jgi:N-acetylglucosaminyldiphosphoundecaprenol N-acetyl-beta-D-mannosaminyltransferase
MDYVFPDGASLIMGAKFAGKRLSERHPGPQILLDLVGTGQSSGLKHYFYGGRVGVVERLSARLKKMYPKAEIAGHESPPFRPLSEQEEAAVRNRINESGANVLWVGLGAPKQELWLQRNIHGLNTSLNLGVGAAFEFFSGDQKWAPFWMRRWGLEWLYRMLTGGPRLFKRYVKYVPLCCYVMTKEAIRLRLARN